LPTPEEKLREFLEEFGGRAHVPLSEEHGRRLRPECVVEETKVREVPAEKGGVERVEELAERSAVPLWMAVGDMLEWHEEYHRSMLRLEYGRESDPTHEILDVDLDNSWFAAYQDQERAKLKALERETCGYEACEVCDGRYCEEPDEHETEYVTGKFEEPVVVLTGRTASGAGRPPVDHARAIAEAWAGPNGSDGVRRSLRYALEEKMGLGAEEWVRWTQGEPHPGDGENRGYHHAHDIVILDAARVGTEITAATFRPVIESHVEKCDPAGREAHDLDVSDWESAPSQADCDCQNGCGECVGTVSVKHVGEEIEESVASYAASYLANEQKDLLERPPEYLAWAATMWATETQKGIKSDSANWAIEADRCDHKHHEGEQDMGHGEEITRKPCRCATAPYGPGCGRCDGRGFHVVCLECMSPWDIEQSETLVGARRGGQVAVADGGAVPEEETAEQSREEELRERWPSAREVASVGGGTAVRECEHEEPDTCPLCATETESPEHTVAGDVPIPEEATASEDLDGEVAGFERPPSWSAKAILRDGEEIPANGGTTEKKPLDLPSAPSRVVSMSAREGAQITCQECREWLEAPSAVREHECEGDVLVWWIPPTEAPAVESVMSKEEFLEAVPGSLEPGGEQDGDGESADVFEPGGEVVRFVENNPDASVAVVMGRFGISPGHRGVVADLVLGG
jgi:hypothetical protein